MKERMAVWPLQEPWQEREGSLTVQELPPPPDPTDPEVWSRTISLSLLLVTLCISWWCVRRKMQYWSRQNVPSTTPVFILGNTLQRLGLSMPFYDFLERAYYEHNGRDFCGFYEFLKPGLIVSNPQLLRSILVRDFDHFDERRTFRLGKVNPVANKMLTNARGEEWKMIRNVVSPTFTTHRSRGIYPLLQQQGDLLAKNVRQGVATSPCCLQTKSFCEKYMMSSIASCAFGITETSDDALLFPEMAAGLLSLTRFRALKVILLLVVPGLADLLGRLGVEFTSHEFVFFKRVVRYTVAVRRKAGTWRGDFLDLLSDTKKLSEEHVTAQAVLFLLAGYANTSTALALALHNLAQHQHAQAALRRELAAAFHKCGGRRLDYDTLQSLSWLSAVVDETLRLYPGGPVIERVCTKDYTLGSTKVSIRKGQPIIVPVWSIHRDPANWPDPLSFNPERFLPHNKKDIKPFTFMPFGVGPRSCVGLRFAELAVKEGLISVVSQFVLSPCKGHSVHPPPIHSKIFTLKTDNLLPLHFAPITDLNSVIRHEHEQYPPAATEDPATRELLASIRDDKFPAL